MPLIWSTTPDDLKIIQARFASRPRYLRIVIFGTVLLVASLVAVIDLLAIVFCWFPCLVPLLFIRDYWTEIGPLV